MGDSTVGPSGFLASGCPICLSQSHALTLAQIDLGDAIAEARLFDLVMGLGFGLGFGSA
jgi:hypothetical protein